MRFVLPLILSSFALGGCMSDFRSEFILPTDCDRRLYFEDRDGDGWGDPNGDFGSLCEPDPDAGLVARNNLDCDDTDPGTTGRVGTLCPDNFVVGGASFVAFPSSGREFAAVLSTSDERPEVTPTTWAQGAAQACGAMGWGGQLATFSNLTEFASVTERIGQQLESGQTYAGWVGLVPSDAGNSWVWSGREGGLNLNEVGFCNPDLPPDPADELHADRRVALVRRSTGRWCFGRPVDANIEDGLVEYTEREAYFVCERSTPQSSGFVVNRPPDGA